MNPRKVSLKGRDLLTLQDFSPEEIEAILDDAARMKKRPGSSSKALEGRSLAMVFQKTSTRTRVSFEVAMRQLGGYALYLRWDDLQLRIGEAVKDTARMLSLYVDGVMARVYRHGDLVELAKYADIPIINGLSDLFHPCQVLADLLTVRERFGKLRGLKLAYVGDGNNMCNSLLVGCTKMGMGISVATPEGYEPSETVLGWAERNARESGSELDVLRDPEKAVEGASVVYTDAFVSMGMEAERAERLKTFLPRYQVTSSLLAQAAGDAVFMHCLPAHRGEEVTDEVLDGPRSIVLDQAENRLHAEKGLLHLIL